MNAFDPDLLALLTEVRSQLAIDYACNPEKILSPEALELIAANPDISGYEELQHVGNMAY